MSSLDATTQATLDKVYEGTGEYLRVLFDANFNAMSILDAHDIFCQTVLQDADVMQLFRSTGRLAGMLSIGDSTLLDTYHKLAQHRLSLIAIETPHRNIERVIQLVGIVRTLVEVLRESQIPQMERMALETS